MSESYSAVRSRLHDKSQKYFVFSQARWDRAKRRMFYGATDALLDAHEAARNYSIAISDNLGANLLVCHGFLQALYVQQDAVNTLSSAVGLNWKPADDEKLKVIRDTRNRLTGHPARTGKSDRPSSAIIPYSEIDTNGFRGHIYYEDQFEIVEVNAAQFQRENEGQLIYQMLLVEKAMDDKERLFREKQSKNPLSNNFRNGFDYLLQRLWTDLSDESHVSQAKAHARMIRKAMELLETQLAERDFTSSATQHLIGVILTGLDFMESIFSKENHTQQDQNLLDLVHDGIEKNVIQLKSLVGELDAQLQRPVERPVV